MKYEVHLEGAPSELTDLAAKSFKEASCLEELVSRWLKSPGHTLIFGAAVDENEALNGNIAVVLKGSDQECAWIEIPGDEIRTVYPGLLSVRELMKNCRRSDDWKCNVDEEESFSEQNNALSVLDNRYPAIFDDDLCTEVLQMEHVIPISLCYAISGHAEVILSQMDFYDVEDQESLDDNSIWKVRLPASLSIMYQDPERGHGFGTNFAFDCGLVRESQVTEESLEVLSV